MYFFFLFVCITAIGIFPVKKKKSWSVFALLLFFCYILMGYNTQNPDYDNYLVRFDIASYPDSNNLLSLLDVSDSSFQAFCKDLGVQTYESYRLILTGLVLAIFGLFVYEKCVCCNVFLLIYIICYLLLDIVQMRNFEAFVILMPFIPLLSKRKLKFTLIYVGGVLLSATIHFSMIFFLLFSFIGIPSKRTRLILIALFLLALIPVSTVMSGNAAIDRVDGYTRSGVWGALFGSFFVVLNYFTMKMVSRISQTQFTRTPKRRGYTQLNAYLIEELNFMLLMIIPFYFINSTISRLLRNISILNVIFILNTIYSIFPYRQKNKLYVVLIIYIFYFAINYIYSNPSVYVTVLTNNSFLGN